MPVAPGSRANSQSESTQGDNRNRIREQPRIDANRRESGTSGRAPGIIRVHWRSFAFENLVILARNPAIASQGGAAQSNARAGGRAGIAGRTGSDSLSPPGRAKTRRRPALIQQTIINPQEKRLSKAGGPA
jgi:hypothetical protein